jgi:hypothetical protein
MASKSVHVTATPSATIGPLPWALEISDPAHPSQTLQCGFAGGTGVQFVAGMRANWGCFRPGQFNSKGFTGYALGTPQESDSKPWAVYYAGATSSQAFQAMVLIAWR